MNKQQRALVRHWLVMTAALMGGFAVGVALERRIFGTKTDLTVFAPGVLAFLVIWFMASRYRKAGQDEDGVGK